MFVPALVSEREAGAWEDCVWASGVMFANGVSGADVHPATRREYEALRFAGTGVAEGNGDGSNLRELSVGLEARYGITAVRRGGGWPDLLARAPIGSYVVLQGSVAGLPRRLQVTAYRGPHCVAWARTGSLKGAWLDPLNPNGTPAVDATLDEARSFYETLPGAEWLVGTQRRITAMAIQVRPELVDVLAETPFYDAPGGTNVGRFVELTPGIHQVGVPMDGSPDKLNLGWRAIVVTTRAIDDRLTDKIVYVTTARLINARPDPGGAADPVAIATARLEGTQAEWDRWHDDLNIPDRPGGTTT